jgi:hypothetical protein
MDAARLRPENISFPGKDMLRKTPADLTDTQIEYLSVASLENDITPEQRVELEINLRDNSSSMAVFSAIQKTRLAAPSVTFKNKSHLKKLTAGQKAFRIVASGVSAAAAIAILVVSYIFIPDLLRERNSQVASATIPENVPYTFLIEATDPIMIIRETPQSEEPFKPAKEDFTLLSAVPDIYPEPALIEYQTLPLAFVPVAPEILYQTPELSLLASNNNIPPSEYYEERGRLRRLIASTFREKVLGEEKYSDDPIKAIDIAIASVGGLNKLLDWNMELIETVDEAGEVKSVYFSSALLTFNSPVRKTN